jgi:hypothetical protein
VGIPPAPRGVPQVEVTFDIDANGILHVSAKDRATGKAQAITITASSGLAKDEVEKMVREAEAHSGEDRKKRELIDLRNQADNLAYSVEGRRETGQRATPRRWPEAVATRRPSRRGRGHRSMWTNRQAGWPGAVRDGRARGWPEASGLPMGPSHCWRRGRRRVHGQDS